MKTITFDEFVEKYKPIQHRESYGRMLGADDLISFDSDGIILAKMPDKHVWTLTTGAENGRDFIQSGKHLVNRLGYYITDEPHSEDVEVTLD